LNRSIAALSSICSGASRILSRNISDDTITRSSRTVFPI